MVLIGIQARSGSKRFPNKVLADICGETMLDRVYEACLTGMMGCDGDVGVAVLCPNGDEPVINHCKERDIPYLEGSETNLLQRYYEARHKWKAKAIIRITGDCPLIPPALIARCWWNLKTHDYVSNCITRSYPDGYDVQGCSKRALNWLRFQPFNKEHIFRELDLNEQWRDTFIREGYSIMEMRNCENTIFKKLSVDTEEDLENVRLHYIEKEQAKYQLER